MSISIFMRPGSRSLSVLTVLFCAACLDSVRAQTADLSAVVTQKGDVVLCLLKGEILFSDRCSGSGRLTIVQPIKHGSIVWRYATGVVKLENEPPQNPDCALSRAKWDPKGERPTASGKRISAVDPVAVLLQISKLPETVHFIDGDISAFALDLDNDGNDEIVFAASNVQRVADLHEKTGQSQHYAVLGGILRKDDQYPMTFYVEQGEYSGGTDTIGSINIKGIVPIAASTGEIAILAKTGSGFANTERLIRYRRGFSHTIETIERMCD